MNMKKYNHYRGKIYFLNIILTIAGAAVMYTITQNLIVTIAAALFLLIGGLLVYIQYKLDDIYISHIVEDLSILCESLVTLDEREVFPENKDTILSKLQNRIFKLIRIYRRKNSLLTKEQENIKALVSDISHQLKTPIANLKMYSEFLDDEEITDFERKQYIDIIKISVDRLNFLSESMIKISRLESGLINLNMQVQSVNETVLTAIKDIFAKAVENELEITYESNEELFVCHDRRWTSEAIFNLLDNAVKYTPPDSTIVVRVKQLGLFMSIEVEDMAEIIPKEERTKLFLRFYRGENSRNIEGIGVGLYLSREIIVRQGGYIVIKQGKSGNIFSIFLPVQEKN